MKILNRKSLGSPSRYYTPTLNVSKNGVFTLNAAAAATLKIKDGDRIVFASDENKYYIGSTTEEESFTVRNHNKPGGSLMFNCKAMVNELHHNLDLALGPDQKKSVRLDLDINPVEDGGHLLYQIY